MTDDWEQIYPKPKPAPELTEIEFWGGPLDGGRRVVADPDEPISFELPLFAQHGEPGVQVGAVKIMYRRRPVGPDESEPMPLRFDYARPEFV